MSARSRIRTTLLAAAAVCLGACVTSPPPSPSAPAAARPGATASIPPMNRTVQDRLVPQVDRLLVQLMEQGRDLRIDDEPAFNGKDKFLPGKIAVGMAWLLLDKPRDSAEFVRYLAGFRRIADLTLQDTNSEWGIYYYLLALRRLDQAGLLDRAVSAPTLARLRERLDWRSFVRERDLTLIDLPNNYYGVAYSVAQLRNELGWEDARAADALLDKALAHYRTYDSGFADEIDGDGRYDRYSVLLIGEIAQHFIAAGRTPPQEVKTWLKGSADLLLLRAGPDGDGFEYGRSIGAYGETAFLEVLSAAAVLGVLNPQQQDVAYTLSSRIAQRYMDFWVDDATGSVDLWDRGRRTDAYRGKHRILGENLSLARQFFYTNALWNRMGYENRAPTADLLAWRRSRPRATLTWFSRGEYERALVTVRDGDRIFGLPFISGGATQHMHSPYFPLPFSPGLVEGVADAQFPQLVPRFTLADGDVLQPLAYYSDITMREEADTVTVHAQAQAMDRMGSEAPIRDARMRVRTEYVFNPGRVVRRDHYLPQAISGPARMTMEFAGYGEATGIERTGTQWQVAYAGQPLRTFVVSGFETCTVAPATSAAYRTPTGALRSVVACRTDRQALDRPFSLEWQMTYGAH